MKTLIQKLAKHRVELEKKVEIYQKFFIREIDRLKSTKYDTFVAYHLAKYNAIKKADRYFKIYNEKGDNR